jgi:hypothetical protein
MYDLKIFSPPLVFNKLLSVFNSFHPEDGVHMYLQNVDNHLHVVITEETRPQYEEPHIC